MPVAGEGGAVVTEGGHYGLQELHRSTRLPRLCASSLILPACAGPAPISYSLRIYFTNLFMAPRLFGRCDRYIASGGTLLKRQPAQGKVKARWEIQPTARARMQTRR